MFHGPLHFACYFIIQAFEAVTRLTRLVWRIPTRPEVSIRFTKKRYCANFKKKKSQNKKIVSFVLYPTRSRPSSFFSLHHYYSAVYQSTLFYWLNAGVKSLLRFYRAFYMNNPHLIYNGNRTEWSSIGSVIIRVIDKIVKVRYVCISRI